MARGARPSKAAIEAEYARVSSRGELAKVFRVSLSTVARWFKDLEITARPRGGEAVRPERRRGGRRYKRTGKLPQHVSLEQAKRLRELAAEHPEWSLREVRDAAECTCSREYVRLILAGERITDPLAYPAPKLKAAPPPKAPPLVFAPRVLPRK